jgi:plasmid maintenance system killer protein
MNIIFKTKKFAKECNDYKLLQIRQGPQRAKLIRRRLDELKAANVLDEIRTLPQARCHELTGDRSGQISVDLDHPYRLLFRPGNNPIPLKPDGGLDWTKVTQIEILGVEDTHA